MVAPLHVYSEHTWSSFVRPSVRFKATEPDTRALIGEMMPYFPKSCVVIAAFLDDADQFWKVNYHWELLWRRTAMATQFDLSQESLLSLGQMRQTLKSNVPNPASGYVESKEVGKPHDHTPASKIVDRWHNLHDVKARLRKVLDAEKIAEKHPPSEPWDLAAAPLAKPGTSKHGTGYAFDIAGHGKNPLIKTICSGLGATLVFDEKSHVHVEFKQGIVVSKALMADDAHDGRWAGWKQLA